MIRELFVTIIRFCEPANPLQLFDSHWEEWTDDFKSRAGWVDFETLSESQLAVLKTLVLLDIEQRLQSWEVALKDCQLPVPTEAEVAMVQQQGVHLHLPAVIREELDFDFTQTEAVARDRVDKMTGEQRAVFDKVMSHVMKKMQASIFIDARGGCGKTFILEAILAAVRTSEPGGAVALAMATTGLAANLLPLGRTFHSRLKVNFPPHSAPVPRWGLTQVRKGASASADRAALPR